MELTQGMNDIIREANELSDTLERLILQLEEDKHEEEIIKDIKQHIKTVKEVSSKVVNNTLHEDEWLSLRTAYNFLRAINKMLKQEE